MTTPGKAGVAGLRGKVQWLAAPAGWVNAGMAVLLVVYLSRTLTLPEHSLWPIFWIALLGGAVLTPLSYFTYFRRTRTLVALGAGKRPLTADALGAAAREVRAFPDLTFLISGALWTMTILLALPLLRWWAGLELGQILRLAGSAAVLAPVGALLTHLLTVLRARRVMRNLAAAGLDAAAAERAIPPTRRQIRPRLMFVGAVMVICPAIITADVALVTLYDGMAELRQVMDPAARAAVAGAAIGQAITGMGVLIALLLTVSLAIASSIGSVIGEPLREMARDAQRIAKGDLRPTALVPAEDEAWALSLAFHSLRAQLATVLARLGGTGAKMDEATSGLASIAARSREAAHGQVASLAETSAATADLARSSQHIAQSAGSVAQSAAETLEAARRGQEQSRAFAAAIAQLRKDNAAVSRSVEVLQAKVQQVGAIVEFITAVADKADLLALNAELEGTKAGQIGRGFSLVASEMRRVAEMVIRAAGEIDARIAEVRQAGGAAAGSSGEAMATTARGEQLAQELSAHLERILTVAMGTAAAAEQISSATGQQRTGAEALAGAMASALEVTEREARSTEQMAGAAASLSALAVQLRGAVSRFEVAE